MCSRVSLLYVVWSIEWVEKKYPVYIWESIVEVKMSIMVIEFLGKMWYLSALDIAGFGHLFPDHDFLFLFSE